MRENTYQILLLNVSMMAGTYSDTYAPECNTVPANLTSPHIQNVTTVFLSARSDKFRCSICIYFVYFV